MHTESPLYRSAFTRYLRHGLSPDLLLKTAMQDNADLLRAKWADLQKRTGGIVQARTDALALFFAQNDRPFPTIDAPDTHELENDFIRAMRAMLEKYSDMADLMPPEELQKRVARSEQFLTSRFTQKIDAVVQPHYGVEYFQWVGGDSENSCDTCSSMSGKIFSWQDNEGPPGCDHCQCSAEPAEKPINDPPIEPVYPELYLLALGRLLASLGKLKDKIESEKPPGKPAPKEPPQKPRIEDRPKNIPKDWKETPSNKGEGKEIC